MISQKHYLCYTNYWGSPSRLVRISFLYDNIVSQEHEPDRRELISMRLKTVEETGDVDDIPDDESWSNLPS